LASNSQIAFGNGDRYEEHHLARCKGVMTVPDFDLAAGLEEVESSFVKGFSGASNTVQPGS
jgi:hypothetical protein